MRNSRKYVLTALLVTAGLILANTVMNFALIPYSYVRIMMHDARTKEFDTVFVGTSHGLCGISPKAVDKTTGEKSVNLCMGGEYTRDAYYLLKQVCQKKIPKQVVYELDYGYWGVKEAETGDFNRIYYEMPWSLTKLEYFFNKTVKMDFRAAITPWFFYRSQLGNVKNNIDTKLSQEYKNYGAEPFHQVLQRYEDGFVKRVPVPGVKTTDDLVLWEGKILDSATSYFEKMVSFCKAKNIELTVITMPVPDETLVEYAEEYQAGDRYFSNYFKQLGVSYMNYNKPEHKIAGFDTSLNAFTDYEGHMSELQAEVFSAHLAEDLLIK